MEHSLDYYVYAHLRVDGTPYYIGKGQKKRAWSTCRNIPRPKDDSRIVILESGLTEIGALALERFYIRWYGRRNNGTGILRNLTDGGDGNNGVIMTEETKRKISKANSGINNPFYGKKHSEETKKKYSESRSGPNNVNFGKVLSEEHRRKLSEALSGENNPNFGKNYSEEHKKKITEGVRSFYELNKGIFSGKNNPMFGQKHSEETKKKMSEIRKKSIKMICCEYCDKQLDQSNYVRWHGNNCKHKKVNTQ
jgi:hypothetical protein